MAAGSGDSVVTTSYTHLLRQCSLGLVRGTLGTEPEEAADSEGAVGDLRAVPTRELSMKQRPPMTLAPSDKQTSFPREEDGCLPEALMSWLLGFPEEGPCSPQEEDSCLLRSHGHRASCTT